MTPYAELLVRPLDEDAAIRAAFHALSREQHPDRDGAAGVPGARWYAITEAYRAVRTAELREAWAKKTATLSGLCASCRGLGVWGSRVGGSKVRVCASCAGEGRKR